MKKFKIIKSIEVIIGVLIIAAAMFLTRGYSKKQESQAAENITEIRSSESTVQTDSTKEIATSPAEDTEIESDPEYDEGGMTAIEEFEVDVSEGIKGGGL